MTASCRSLRQPVVPEYRLIRSAQLSRLDCCAPAECCATARPCSCLSDRPASIVRCVLRNDWKAHCRDLLIPAAFCSWRNRRYAVRLVVAHRGQARMIARSLRIPSMCSIASGCRYCRLPLRRFDSRAGTLIHSLSTIEYSTLIKALHLSPV